MTTARHAAHTTTPFAIVLLRLLKRVLTRRRPPVTPLEELLTEEFTPSQVAGMAANERKALRAIAIAVVLAAVVMVVYLVAVQHFVNAELGPLFDQLMKPSIGASR